jgi:hypothetical protein
MTDDLDRQRVTLLAQRLAAATAARDAQWQLDADDVYTWGSDTGSVSVASRDRDGEPPYELSVYNRDRLKVDELTSELFSDDRPAPWNEVLADLYRLARRSALRADDIIDALIEALPAHDQDGPIQRERSFFGLQRRGEPAVEDESP